MAAAEKVVVELTIDARGAQAGQAQFEAAMKKTEVVINGAASGVERSWNRIIGGLDPVAKAQIKAAEEIAKTAKITENAVKRGLATEEQAALIRAKNIQQQEQYVAAAKKAAGANDNIAKSAGLARHELINLGRQGQDVATMLAMGASPISVITSQAAQIGDILMSTEGTMKGFGRQMLGLVTPARLVAGALAAVGATAIGAVMVYRDSQRELANSLTGIGRGSGQTVESLNRIAGSAQGLSTFSAREVAGTYAGTGKIGPEILGRLVNSTSSFGLMTGQDPAEAAKQLATAFADPIRGADQLNERFGFLSDKMREFIRNSIAMGDRTTAQKALMDALSASLSENQVKLSLWAQTWNGVSSAINKVGEAIEFAVAPDKLQQLWKAQNDVALLSRLPFGGFGMLSGATQNRDALLRSIRGDRENASFRASNIQANETSRTAGDIIRRFSPDVLARQSLQNDVAAIEKLVASSAAMEKLGISADDANKVLARLKSGLDLFQTATDKAREDGALQIKQINAYTLQQRADVAATQARIEAMRALKDATTVAAEAENARNAVIAQASRQIRDSARDLRDQGSLVGRYGLDRTLQEITNRFQRMREQYGTGTGAANDNAPGRGAGVERILDAIERFESGGRNVPNYKFGPGYTAQGHFQITNTTWRGIAGAAGIDLGQYPNAMSAPYDVQRNAARALIARNGVSDWLPYNPRFRAWYEGGGAGAAGSGMSIDAQEAEAKRQATVGAQIDPLREANVALDAQIAAQRAAMGVFGQTTAQIVAQAESVRLLNEYTRNNVPITDEMKAGIEDYAQRAGAAAQANQMLGDSMRQVSDWNSALADGVKGLVHDFRAGKSAGEAFGNMLSRLADRGIDSLINMVFGAGGAQGGLLGSLFGGLLPKPGAIFANGGIMTPYGSMPLNRYETGGIATGPQMAIFGEGRQNEAYVPLPDGRTIPVTMRMPANNNQPAGNVTINAPVTMNVPAGTDEKMMTYFQKELTARDEVIARQFRDIKRSQTQQQTGVARG